ncbi:MAG: hypothetical protein JJE39_10095 [Vicinamibacteria bacterium]|nr:hypothetical protein [Vicinamibacteria bacterium]
MKTIIGVLALAAIGVAYFVGYWPERQSRLATETTLEATRANLEQAQARNRLYGLQSKLIELLTTVEARNFGEAQGQSTVFFNEVRTEAGRPDQSQVRSILEGIVAGRDTLTVALTQNDPATLDMLHALMARLREALGETPPPAATEPIPSPSAVPSPT